jgi:hypothetical protein
LIRRNFAALFALGRRRPNAGQSFLQGRFFRVI